MKHALGRALMALVMLSSFAALAPAVSADTRCGGSPGIQTWENLNWSGRSVIWCTDDHNQIRVSDLSTHHENLFPWESWDNRISSLQSFNIPSGFSFCIYQNANYNPSGGDRLMFTNNNSWNLSGSFASMNDQTSSIKYTASC